MTTLGIYSFIVMEARYPKEVVERVGSSSEDEREDLFHASLLVSGGCPQCLVFFQCS
jgi:hypothetical protein